MTIEATRPVVIVIDDDPTNILLLTRIFARKPDIEIVTESDGQAGLDLIRDRTPALLLLDLNLAGLSGESILSAMRASAETAEIPVVIISGDASDSTKRRLLAAGAQHYLEKPYTISELLDVVAKILG
jgi:DNA-binding response OmpR family regulator